MIDHRAPASPAAGSRGRPDVDINTRRVLALLEGARRAAVDPCAVLAVLALQEALGALGASEVARRLSVSVRTAKRHLAGYRAAWAASAEGGDRGAKPVTPDGTPMAPDGGGEGGAMSGESVRRPETEETDLTQEERFARADQGGPTQREAPREQHPPEHVRAACARHLRENLRLVEPDVRYAMDHLTRRWRAYGGTVKNVLEWAMTVVINCAREKQLARRDGRDALDELSRLDVCRRCGRTRDPLYPEAHAACRP